LEGPVLSNLDKKITSGAELNEDHQFVIAYYLDDGTGLLKPPLYIDRYDLISKTWESATLDKLTPKGESWACLGAVLEITSLSDQLILETHIDPSAGCALILSRKLELEAALNGWLLGHFDDGTIIYHRSEVHFATVHPAEIAVYEEKSGKDYLLYPPKPESPVRERLTAELRDFFHTHQEYCTKANDPCDPTQFDSALAGQIALDPREHAIAFVISYQLQGFGQDEQKPSGPEQVIYVYRHVNDESRMEYRELLPDEIKAQFGDISLQSLLDPDRLRAIFQEPGAEARRRRLNASRSLHSPAVNPRLSQRH
jgi:hypothetical protein